MANVTETAVFDAGVYRIETTDAVIGGESGISNKGIKNLANRTLYLKSHLDAAESTIVTYGTTLGTHTTKLNALDASRLVSEGLNFSKGQIVINSGSPYAVPADAVGKIIRIVPNGASITVRVPALSSIGLGSGFYFTFNDTTGVLQAFKALMTSVDGLIVGDVENFRDGDSCIMIKYDASTWQLIVLSKRNQVEPGTPQFFAAATPPPGYIEANGAAISRTTYARLFAHIGVANGVGDGTTTFNIPDLRGVFIRGWDNGRGVDPSRVFGSYQDDELEAHTHTTPSKQNQNTYNSGFIAGTGADAAATINTGSTGGTETRPKNVALLACIKY
jgi:phage-related tail fiber protein